MMPPAAVALFNGALFAYFGVQPNQAANIGLGTTLGRIQITGVSSPIRDDFTEPVLEAARWQVVAENASGIIPVPTDALCWLTWTLPDTGFILQSSAALPASWSNLGLTPVQVGAFKRVLVRPSQLSSNSAGKYFFQLRK